MRLNILFIGAKYCRYITKFTSPVGKLGRQRRCGILGRFWLINLGRSLRDNVKQLLQRLFFSAVAERIKTRFVVISSRFYCSLKVDVVS